MNIQIIKFLNLILDCFLLWGERKDGMIGENIFDCAGYGGIYGVVLFGI